MTRYEAGEVAMKGLVNHFMGLDFILQAMEESLKFFKQK